MTYASLDLVLGSGADDGCQKDDTESFDEHVVCCVLVLFEEMGHNFREGVEQSPRRIFFCRAMSAYICVCSLLKCVVPGPPLEAIM